MKKFILNLWLLLPVLALAQYGSNQEYKKFTKSEKKFNDWSVTLYGGLPFMQSADLTSFNNISDFGSSNANKSRIGYDLQLGVTKHINHVVGIQLLYAWGHSKQGHTAKKIEAETKYQSASVLGDINLTSLFRRVDNKSTYRWAWHLIGGIGILDYNTYLNEAGKKYNSDDNTLGGSKSFDAGIAPKSNDLNASEGFYPVAEWAKRPFASFFGQVGTSLKFKINRRWDLEGKVMYVISGDDLFDGGGSGTSQNRYSHINALNKQISDNMITTHLGISYKIGKHKEHLQWYDPLAILYPPKDNTGGSGVCMEDKDEDAVCDDLDRQLDTPKGARVDGAGVAMDTDYDGLIDPLDKCPTIPGPVENQGCPLVEENKVVEGGKIKPSIADGSKLPAIEFLLDSDKLTNESTPILDNAASIIKEYFPTDRIVVEGHTDAHSSDAYNQKLSQRRVETVVRYLGTKGVNTANLIPVGKGESELKLSQCQPATKCTDAQNKQNRRVVFKLQ
jgi:OOP family OmpA-OmpF porin